ncbi:MAG: helix-turn-helix domain-containing protein [Candidatus Bathyarchaeia archaeon]
MARPLDEALPYDKALEARNRRRIVKALAELGGEASFSQIERVSKVTGNTLVYNLEVLERRFCIIEKPVKGTYRLRFRTPLSYLFAPEGTYPTVYFGLLGRRDRRDVPETKVALDLLKEEKIIPQLVYVTTTLEALQEWKELKLPYQWITVYEADIADIDSVKNRVRPQLEILIKDHVVILDCTSATKPATIAYYELANQYLIPLIYIYEPIRSLKWLISRQNLLQRIGMHQMN